MGHFPKCNGAGQTITFETCVRPKPRNPFNTEAHLQFDGTPSAWRVTRRPSTWRAGTIDLSASTGPRYVSPSRRVTNPPGRLGRYARKSGTRKTNAR